MMNYLVPGLACVTTIFLLITAMLCIKGKKKSKNYVECTGTILRLNRRTAAGRGTEPVDEVSPVVAYEVNGQKIEFEGRYCTTSMKAGDTVSILYDPENPKKAVLKKGLLVAPLITGCLGIASLIAMIIVWLLKQNGVM